MASEDAGLPFTAKRKHFLVTVAFALTINKSQGQTIPNVGICLPESVLSHGQLYVALSRGKSFANTKVLSLENDEVETAITKTVVFQEALLPRQKKNKKIEENEEMGEEERRWSEAGGE